MVSYSFYLNIWFIVNKKKIIFNPEKYKKYIISIRYQNYDQHKNRFANCNHSISSL